MSPKTIYKKSRADFIKNKNINVFIIMRYSEKKPFLEIEQTIKKTLKLYGLKGILAKDVKFNDLLWEHIQFCLENSRYAVAVFEQILQPDFNPNVALELGFMLAIGKPCLILKDSSMDKLHSDIMGHLYEPFDSYNIEETIATSIERWLMKLGHGIIPPSILITDDIPINAYKKRTVKIVEELTSLESQPKLSTTDCIIRQAASLTSIAICDDEKHDDDFDGQLLKLLLKERNKFQVLIDKGFKIKLIVFPYIHVSRIRSGNVDEKYTKQNIIPRYYRLIQTIEKNIDNNNFQIVHVDAPHYDNLIIIGNKAICKGEKRPSEKGFRSSTFIYNPTEIGSEIEKFDYEFKDSAGLILKKKDTQSKDHSSKELKEKVILRLKRTLQDIENEIKNHL